jgi:hypothetical protein
VLLADAVWDWDAAVAMGEIAFRSAAAEGGRRGARGGAGNGHTNGYGAGRSATGATTVPVGPGLPAVATLVRRTIAHVSPLRGGGVLGTIEVGAAVGIPAGAGLPPRPPLSTAEAPEPESLASLGPEQDEPPLPEEARRALFEAAAPDQPTPPIAAAPGQALHVHFGAAGQEALVGAFEGLRQLIAERPGETPVLLHLPGPGGRMQAMQLRSGVAYDADLLAEIHRRLGVGLATLELA